MPGDVRPVGLRRQDDRAAVRYATDGAAQGKTLLPTGIFVDDISRPRRHDAVHRRRRDRRQRLDARRLQRRSSGSITSDYDHYYIASNRTYVVLRQVPADRARTTSGSRHQPDFVEHFPYQNGLLVCYWDTSQSDNNTSEHPGEGLILPIDANPRPIYRLDGSPWRAADPTYDAPFGLEKSDSFTLHVERRGRATSAARPAQPLFDDNA